MQEQEQPDLFQQWADGARSTQRLLRREELPTLVWQTDALMRDRRQPRDAVEEKFVAYHRDNPHVYALFDQYAHVAIDKGKTSYSAWNVINRLRWDIDMKAVDQSSEFMISNDYIAFYARWWMERNLDYLDFFDTKFRKIEVAMIKASGREAEGRTEGIKRRREWRNTDA